MRLTINLDTFALRGADRPVVDPRFVRLPPCPQRCGATIEVAWSDTSLSKTAPPAFVPDRWRCPRGCDNTSDRARKRARWVNR